MPDITMCQNKNCRAREECYRFVANPDFNYQSYGLFKPTTEDDECEDFLDKKYYLNNQ